MLHTYIAINQRPLLKHTARLSAGLVTYNQSVTKVVIVKAHADFVTRTDTREHLEEGSGVGPSEADQPSPFSCIPFLPLPFHLQSLRVSSVSSR